MLKQTYHPYFLISIHLLHNLQIYLNAGISSTIIDSLYGIFIINVYGEGLQCKTFHAAKSKPTDTPIINILLEVGDTNQTNTVTLTWNLNDTIKLTSTNDGAYDIMWF